MAGEVTSQPSAMQGIHSAQMNPPPSKLVALTVGAAAAWPCIMCRRVGAQAGCEDCVQPGEGAHGHCRPPGPGQGAAG